MPLKRPAAILFTLLSASILALLIAWAAGATWSAFILGGTLPGKYSTSFRIGVLIQAGFLLFVMTLIVLSKAGLLMPALTRSPRWLIWVTVAYAAAGLVFNLVTSRAGDRAVCIPVAFLLLVCSLIVALSRPAVG